MKVSLIKLFLCHPLLINKIDKSSQLYFREEVEDLYEIHDDGSKSERGAFESSQSAAGQGVGCSGEREATRRHDHVLLYGSETWLIRAEDKLGLNTFWNDACRIAVGTSRSR